ncbi:acetyl-CoA acetyltransferase [Synergistales bacterium]|nr:acetyl-CoA acetyltransferase [Synergistales bacterium]
MREVVVLGVGMTKFAKHVNLGLKDLSRSACWDAFKDSGGVNPKDIELAYVANAIGGIITGQTLVGGQVFLREVGIHSIPIINVEDACASGSVAVMESYHAIRSGRCDIALALGVEKMYAGDTMLTTTALAGGGDVELELANGVNFPSHWALRAKKRMELFGTTREHFAMVSVKNHKNGCYNHRAQYQKECTIEQVINSRIIADPMTQLSCSPIGDGAAAVILCAKEKAGKYKSKHVSVAGFGISTGSYNERRDITFNEIEQRCGLDLYKNASIGPEDIDFAEVHDCFTIAEFMRVEGLGLYKHGEYDRALERGETEIGGKLPINPSGGLLAKGHPVAATGVAQICELVWQLRGEAGQRQVEGARIGMAHCSGGGIAGDGAVSVASILKKDY